MAIEPLVGPSRNPYRPECWERRRAVDAVRMRLIARDMNADHAHPTLYTLAERHYAPGDRTRKGPSYLREYERVLLGREDQPLRLLELGISSGASMLLWRDYLPSAVIVGIDIEPMPAVLAEQARIHCLRGSQDDPAILDRAAVMAGGRLI